MRPYAWAVEYGAGLVALFLDRARAEHAAISLHGRLVALYSAAPQGPIHPTHLAAPLT